MRVLKMSGMQISSPQRFIKYFSPADFLVNKELAAGFACHQLGLLSGWNKYNSEMLFLSVFNPSVCYGKEVLGYMDYFDAEGPYSNLIGYSRNVPGTMSRDVECCGLLKKVWDLSCETSLSNNEKIQLFSVLASGYLLAEKNFEECPISPEAAELAFTGIRAAGDEESKGWFSIPDGEVVLLEAREEPYRILADGRKRLENGEELGLKKLLAVPHKQGSRELPVQLEICYGEGDTAPQRVCFMPGDYRYCLKLGSVPLRILDVESENGSCRMVREADSIRVFVGGKQSHEINCKGKDILGFAPESNGQGWIIVERGKVDYSNYSKYPVYGQRLSAARKVVEVQLRSTLCLLLDSKGRVVCNMPGVSGRGLTSLDDVKLG